MILIARTARIYWNEIVASILKTFEKPQQPIHLVTFAAFVAFVAFVAFAALECCGLTELFLFEQC
jgi:hypothetical protein